MSWPWLRSDQILAEVAVASGVQGRNACGETPSTLALCPLTMILPPSTGSTATTPPSLRILATWAEVMPPGTAAMRSGTYCCLDAAVPAGAAVAEGPVVGTEADETCEEGVPPAGGLTAASAAWTADPATPTDSATTAAAASAARCRVSEERRVGKEGRS